MSGAASKATRSAQTDPRDARAKGRELALLALCHLESYPAQEHAEALQLLWSSPPSEDGLVGRAFMIMVGDADVRGRADELLRDLIARWAEIDAAITETSERWRLDRMAQVDRNVLRMSAIELVARPKTPKGVVMAEAVRLARRYGSERSATFVNGVAEALARRLRPEAASAGGSKG